MAKDKKLLSENQVDRWAKLANIKSSLKSGILTESKKPVTEQEEPVTEQEELEDELEDLEGPEGEPGDEEGLDLEEPATEATVADLVQAIAVAVNDVVGDEVIDVGIEGEEELEGEEGLEDDFVPGDELEDEEDLVAEATPPGRLSPKRSRKVTDVEDPTPVPGRDVIGGEGPTMKAAEADKERQIDAEEQGTTDESLMREQTYAVRNYIISEVAKRVRVRAAHEAQKQQIAESLADRIFTKLRNKTQE